MREIGHRLPQRRPLSILKVVFLALVLALITFGVVKILNLEKFVLKGPKTVVQLITDSGLQSDKGRVNILLLGIGGRGHDGPDLTDTIILASIDKEGKDVAMVSIPRDLWAPSLRAKINHAYAYGQEDNGRGPEKAKATVASLFQMPIHYAFRVDFNGFTKAVDEVGGLDLTVDNPFIDPKYPIPGKEDDLCGMTIETVEQDGASIEVVKTATGSAIPLSQIDDDEENPFTCRFETLTFTAGPTHMDGVTALKFVRSRHGTGGEGSDFARATRQQKVILAFREKVVSTKTFLNPVTLIDLAKTFGGAIDTDIADEEVPLFIKLGTRTDPASIRKIVLDSNPQNGRLEFGLPQDYQGQSVLIPKGASWTDLAEYIQGEIYKTTETNTNNQDKRDKQKE